MLWACIRLPQLPLDVVLRRHPRPDTPIVLLGGSAQKRLLTVVNPAAARLGLHAGQRLTEAQAMATGFEAIVEQPAEVWQARQLLAQWAYRYTDQVCLSWPDALLLEVGASLRLMGGWPTLEARLRAELAEWQFEHRIGLAPTAHAAHVLAGWQDGMSVSSPDELRAVLAPLPIRQAELPDETGTALRRLGIRHLGQLMRLPRAGLQHRFGEALCQHLDWLMGQRPAVLDGYQPPARFEMAVELPCRVETHLPLMFPLRRLLADLVGFLASRGQGTQHLSVWLDHEDERPPTRLDIRLMRPERDLALFVDLLKTRLEQVVLPAPVTGLGLRVTDLPDVVPVVRDLFDQASQGDQAGRDHEPWSVWQARLCARLGDEALYQLEACDEHRPERAWRRLSLGVSTRGELSKDLSLTGGGRQVAMAGPGSTPALASVPWRPAWLLPKPEPLREGILRVLAGPERIESGWWDGEEARRDYYRVETVRGQQAWVYTTVGTHGPWMVHGWFA
ncbi:MAG: DNA polymerase Y family protein [Lautropia sp.]|nr:DNA polymerase Y family protein [Lautropia sp.]